MTIDQAIGKLYLVLGKCRDMPEYVEAVQALGAVEDAAEALTRSQRMLEIVVAGRYESELHDVQCANTIANNRRSLMP